MPELSSTVKVIESLAQAGQDGLALNELLRETSLNEDHLEVLTNNLCRSGRVTKHDDRFFLRTIKGPVNFEEYDEARRHQATRKARKDRIEQNLRTCKKTIDHYNALISVTTRMMQEQIDEIQVDRLEVPPMIRFHETHSGPRKVVWSPKEREAYRKSLGKKSGAAS